MVNREVDEGGSHVQLLLLERRPMTVAAGHVESAAQRPYP
jgi:hypothetical protein